MNTFAQAVKNQTTVTANGMTAFVDSSDACVTLFYKIAAMRGNDPAPMFTAAMVENSDYAVRIAQWARDIRQGAGERDVFKNILLWLEANNTDVCNKLIKKIPEIGRGDDGYCLTKPETRSAWFNVVKNELAAGNALIAKWAPREKSAKSSDAKDLRRYLKLDAKTYRKLIAGMSSTVEDKMCANDWDNINFNHVPSVAAAKYRKAFARHTPKFAEYVAALSSGDPQVKVNAAAIFPHEVIKGLTFKCHYADKWPVKGGTMPDQIEIDHMIAQWAALPNYVGAAKILPLVDVSGSMLETVHGSKVTCMDVAVSLGLYLSEKNTGSFKDMFLTFSSNPQLLSLKGNVVERVQQMVSSEWGMNTDLNRAMDKILKTAVDGAVSADEMPNYLLILSDMNFDQSDHSFNESAINMINRKFTAAGYIMPAVIFWNLNAQDHCPVKFDQQGTCLVSGFSPAILKGILAAEVSQITPEKIMLDTISNPRYDW